MPREMQATVLKRSKAADGRENTARARRARVQEAARRARQALLSLQREDGHWCAEFEGDTILESEYVLCLYFLDQLEPRRLRQAASYIRRQQGDDGGWPTYPGGSADVSSSVKAYLVLKLAGDDPAAEHMTRARERILELGGVEATNSFTRIYLSLFGEYDWRRCPAVPPEMILLPRWLYFNVYAMSAWSRTIVVPLSMIWAHKPCRPLPEQARIPELRRPSGAGSAPAEDLKARAWGLTFRVINAFLCGVERLGIRPLRRRALAACEAWILERLERSDGLGAIFPPIINTLIALRSAGYDVDHPVIRAQLHELEKLEIEEDDTLRLQPCFSPVWDTALALDALEEAALGEDDPHLLEAARWLLAKEVRQPGDGQLIDPAIPVGGWYFEYANEFYPDCDDTAQVVKVLSRVRFDDPGEERARRAALERGAAWLRAMQNRDGGWGAFDRGCDKEVLTYVPFADHNAMIDPSTTDVTSRSLEALLVSGAEPSAPEIRRAVDFIYSCQESDGTWYGRWGCNYLYGTWLALRALRLAGEDMGQERIRRAADWIRERQNPDGGWGELPLSYDDPAQKGIGPSTASQTAWALMGLMAAGDLHDEAIEGGVEHLLATQLADGGWKDEFWTGTGFPRVFYIRYHLYATYFPLHALAWYERRSAERPAERARIAVLHTV